MLCHILTAALLSSLPSTDFRDPRIFELGCEAEFPPKNTTLTEDTRDSEEKADALADFLFKKENMEFSEDNKAILRSMFAELSRQTKRNPSHCFRYELRAVPERNNHQKLPKNLHCSHGR